MSDLVLTPLTTPTVLVHGLNETYFDALSVHHFLTKTWLSIYQFLPKHERRHHSSVKLILLPNFLFPFSCLAVDMYKTDHKLDPCQGSIYCPFTYLYK